MMNRLSEKDQRTLRVGGYAVGAILILLVGVFPAMDYWESLNSDITKRQKELQTIKQGVEDAAQARRLITSLEASATLHSQPGDLNQQTALMLQQVERLGTYRGLIVRRLEGMPLREDEEVYRSGVSLQFSSTLSNLSQFLEELERSRPALKVDRLTLTSDPKVSARVEGQMVLSGYAVVTGKGGKG